MSGNQQNTSIPVIQIVGYKNAGKTTLITSLLSLWAAAGKRVAVIKHDAHNFQMDHEGTDTFAHTEAGAAAVAITSPSRTAILYGQSTPLDELIHQLAQTGKPPYDLIIVEGFKMESYPKVVIVADEAGLELVEQVTALHWIYARLQPEIVAAHFSNLKQTPIIPCGKDGIMELFTLLNAYIES
ncbi:molybdopterin-guanine dinucleotide biosynthesis protein B [Paenibacillus sp. WLX1005]|uniref:molybdopterin-guanine dinucleotide biosynthesis protein B n=1 Tax=unclassified Paenibacillus TaxID=185978 RepID=UPI0039840B94